MAHKRHSWSERKSRLVSLMKRNDSLRRPGTLLFAFAFGLATAAAAGAQATDPSEGRNFDARERLSQLAAEQPALDQVRAIETLRDRLPGVVATYDRRTGVTRTLRNREGYLTEPRAGDPTSIAVEFARGRSGLLGLDAADIAEHEVADVVPSRITGSTHVYLRQRYRGLPVYNGQLQIHVNHEGRISGVNNHFMPGVAQATNNIRPGLGAFAAVESAAEHLGIAHRETPRLLSSGKGPEQLTRFSLQQLSLEPIEARLKWLPIRRGEMRLVWNFQIHTIDEQHIYDLTVDAETGQVWTRFDWVNSEQYRVYARPTESPNHTTPLPPEDGRQVVVNPADAVASPLGWHDTGNSSFQIMRGNNVHAYDDRDANNSPPSSQPSCGSSLDCDFPINLDQGPTAYTSAAVANLFYWNNVVHDIQYQYGFDEPSGNFQVNNFNRGGAQGDDVRAEAQDGGGTNNANFATPPDGSRPRMQMYLWNLTNPGRDGSLDAGIVVHEYGHGISIRQVGGPSNVNCLNNRQQPGEGWSDFFSLVYTAREGDLGTDIRGVGTYALGQPLDGDGIRTQPYSTDPSINTHTYESIRGMAVPHGVGEVWAQALWEVYWALVDKYGFDSDLYNVSAGAGNHRALLYVNEGLKNTACSPTFTDARDGIIQAASDLFSGEDVCLLWKSFADFGLGVDAVSGGSNSTNPTNGFEIPAECQCEPQPIVDAGPDLTVCPGQAVTIGTPARAGHSYAWSPGGQTSAQIVVSPAVTTTYTLTATTACGSQQDSVTVFVAGQGGLEDHFETGAPGWTASGLWHLANDSTCAAPEPGYSSPLHAFYYGQDSTCNYNTGGSTSGSLTSPLIEGINSNSTLTFDYLREVESYTGGSYDRTNVEVVTANGATTVFSLDSTQASEGVWKSSGALSLAAFAGQSIQVRFQFDSRDGVANNFPGWFIDDVVVRGSSQCGPANTPPEVNITSPPDGTSVEEGATVQFSGTATDAEDGDLSASIAWESDRDGALGSGGTISTSTLSLGEHTITARALDSGNLEGSDSVSVTVLPKNEEPGIIDWNVTETVAYSNQDGAGTTAVEDGGATFFLEGNRWRRTNATFTITPFTVIEFEFQSTSQGEIHGIGFDEDDLLTNDLRIFQIFGTQNWSDAIGLYKGDYPTLGSFVKYRIPVGAFYTGSGFRLVVVNDKDSGSLDNTSRFRNVRVFESVPEVEPLDFFLVGTGPYAGQDVSGTLAVEEGGLTLFMEGNRWRRSNQSFTITPDTIVAFEFKSTSQGEIHGLGFDEDDLLTNGQRVFKVYGSQNWSGDVDWFQQYGTADVGSFKTFVIPVGRYYQGSALRLILTNDKDFGTANHNSRFRNVRIYQIP